MVTFRAVHGITKIPSRFRDALILTEAESDFRSLLIEKDYYCSLLLQDLWALFEHGLVFKGGTCLSKVHAEFFRLSEDLDSISVRPDATKSQRRELPRRSGPISGSRGPSPLFRSAEPFAGSRMSGVSTTGNSATNRWCPVRGNSSRSRSRSARKSFCRPRSSRRGLCSAIPTRRDWRFLP